MHSNTGVSCITMQGSLRAAHTVQARRLQARLPAISRAENSFRVSAEPALPRCRRDRGIGIHLSPSAAPLRNVCRAAGPDGTADVEVDTAAAFTQPAAAPANEGGFPCKHLLLTILDPNPYLSAGSKQALSTAFGMSISLGSRLTVAFIDTADCSADLKVRSETLEFYVAENQWDHVHFKVMEMKMEEGGKGTLAVTDLAEEKHADLVLLSTDALHDKAVDANLLSEFVLCPVLLVPDA